MKPGFFYGDCTYCDSTSIVETDNNGPIVACPMCQPPEMDEQGSSVALTEYKVPGMPEPAESEYYTKVEKLVANEQDARIRSKFMKSGLIEEGKQ